MSKKYKSPEEELSIVNEPETSYQIQSSTNITEEEFESDLVRSLSGEEFLERAIVNVREMYRNK